MNQPFNNFPPSGDGPPPSNLGGYRLVELLGRGGMGEVYRAERDGPGGYRKRAALKRILPRFQNDPTLRARFLAEARINARLEHPNIVQVLDFGDQPEPYLALEYVEGTTVARVLKQCADAGARIPAAAAAFIVAEAAAGLDYAHRRRDDNNQPLHIVHRDVSPQNILVSLDGSVKISDFGIARAADNQLRTAAGISVGKLAYMAPEQATGGVVDHRADVFALGVVLWEVLLVRPLIPRNDSNAAIQMLLAGRFDAPSRIDPKLPSVIDQIVAEALAVDPNRRTASAGQLAQALRGFVHAMAPGFDGGELVRILARLVPEVRWQEPGSRGAWPAPGGPNVPGTSPGAPQGPPGAPATMDVSAFAAAASGGVASFSHPPLLPDEDGATRVFEEPESQLEGRTRMLDPDAGHDGATRVFDGQLVADPYAPLPPMHSASAPAPLPLGLGSQGTGAHSAPGTAPQMYQGTPSYAPAAAPYPSPGNPRPSFAQPPPGAPPGAPPGSPPGALQGPGPLPSSPAPAPGFAPLPPLGGPSAPGRAAAAAPEPDRAPAPRRNLIVWIATPLILLVMVGLAAILFMMVTSRDDTPPPAQVVPISEAPVSVPVLVAPPPPPQQAPAPVPAAVPAAPPPQPMSVYEARARAAVTATGRDVQACIRRSPDAAEAANADVTFDVARGAVSGVTVNFVGPRGNVTPLRECMVTALQTHAHFATDPGAAGATTVRQHYSMARAPSDQGPSWFGWGPR